jgi:hypothetical protein
MRFKSWLCNLAVALALATTLAPGTALAQKKNANDTFATEEKEKEDPGSPVYAYIFVSFIALGLLMTVCKSSRRTVPEQA